MRIKPFSLWSTVGSVIIQTAGERARRTEMGRGGGGGGSYNC